MHGGSSDSIELSMLTLLQMATAQTTSFMQALRHNLEEASSNTLTTSTLKNALASAAQQCGSQLDTGTVSALLRHCSRDSRPRGLQQGRNAATTLTGVSDQMSVDDIMQTVRWKGLPIVCKLCDPSAAITWLQEHRELFKEAIQDSHDP